MKAIVNGVEVEGTVEEIIKYQALSGALDNKEAVKEVNYIIEDDVNIKEVVKSINDMMNANSRMSRYI